MVCRAEFRGGISDLKRDILSLRASKTGKPQVEFRYEDFYSEFRGKISLWNLDWNSMAKPRYKILIRISRRHFKTKFCDLNFAQDKNPAI